MRPGFPRWGVLGLLAGLAACGPLPPPADTARLPSGVFSPLEQTVPATQYAQYAFADASRTYGNPVAGAQAVLALDYIAGELNTGSQWAYVPAIIQLQLLQARLDTRQAVGIAPGASSQLVVDSLVRVRHQLQLGDTAGALSALANPAFAAAPDEVLHRLANLPYIQSANVATTRAAEAVLSPDDAGSAGN